MNELVKLFNTRVRKYVYAVSTAGLALFALWQASNGDWVQFSVAVVTSLVTALATANTKPEPQETPEA